jgi:hypothetical protein
MLPLTFEQASALAFLIDVTDGGDGFESQADRDAIAEIRERLAGAVADMRRMADEAGARYCGNPRCPNEAGLTLVGARREDDYYLCQACGYRADAYRR